MAAWGKRPENNADETRSVVTVTRGVAVVGHHIQIIIADKVSTGYGCQPCSWSGSRGMFCSVPVRA